MEWVLLVGLPMMLLAGIVCVAAAFLRGATEALGRSDLQSRLRRDRSADTYAMFQQYFSGSSAREQAVRAVYDHLSNRVFQRRGFPVRPTDDLQQVFDIGPDSANDLDLLQRNLAGRIGLRYVPRNASDSPPRTVEEMVYDMARMPARGETHDADTLLRPSGPDGDLLRPATDSSVESGETLLRPSDAD